MLEADNIDFKFINRFKANYVLLKIIRRCSTKGFFSKVTHKCDNDE